MTGGGVLGEQGSTDSGRPGCGWGRSFRGTGVQSALPAEWGGEGWLRHNEQARGSTGCGARCVRRGTVALALVEVNRART